VKHAPLYQIRNLLQSGITIVLLTRFLPARHKTVDMPHEANFDLLN